MQRFFQYRSLTKTFSKEGKRAVDDLIRKLKNSLLRLEADRGNWTRNWENKTGGPIKEKPSRPLGEDQRDGGRA